MPCVPIRMPDESTVLANVKHGEVLTETDKLVLIELTISIRRKSKQKTTDRYCSTEECFWAKSNGPCPKHGQV